MSNFDETIGGVNFMVVDGIALVVREDSEERLDVEDVLKLSEFVASAYEALEGQPYAHAQYDKSFVSTLEPGEYVIPKQYLAPSIDMASDPGPHGDSYGREHNLERDCE